MTIVYVKTRGDVAAFSMNSAGMFSGFRCASLQIILSNLLPE
jgi:hypothetical protein